jgi:hypothetical protein
MGKVHNVLDENGTPTFGAWGEGKLLRGTVAYRVFLNRHRGSGTNTPKGAGLMFDPRSAEGHRYRMMHFEDDVKVPVNDIFAILNQQEEQDLRASNK